MFILFSFVQKLPFCMRNSYHWLEEDTLYVSLVTKYEYKIMNDRKLLLLLSTKIYIFYLYVFPDIFSSFKNKNGNTTTTVFYAWYAWFEWMMHIIDFLSKRESYCYIYIEMYIMFLQLLHFASCLKVSLVIPKIIHEYKLWY